MKLSGSIKISKYVLFLLLTDMAVLAIQILLSHNFLAQYYMFWRFSFGAILFSYPAAGGAAFILQSVTHRKGKIRENSLIMLFIQRIFFIFIQSIIIIKLFPMAISINSELFILILLMDMQTAAVFFFLIDSRVKSFSRIILSFQVFSVLINSTLRDYSLSLLSFRLLIILVFFLIYYQFELRHRDMEKRLAQNKRIRELSEKLHVLEQSRQMTFLTASVIHEVNNPLTPMRGNLYFIRQSMDRLEKLENRGDLKKDVKKELAEIRNELTDTHRQYSIGFERIQEMIGRLKSLGKSLSQSEYSLRDASQILDDVIQLIVPSYQRAEIKVNRWGDLNVYIREGDLFALFSNLIKNALEAYGGDNLTLEVELYRDSVLCFNLSDNGPGYDGSPVNNEKSGGMNLGLSICREICKRNRGTLNFYPSPSGGTRVEARLSISNRETDI